MISTIESLTRTQGILNDLPRSLTTLKTFENFINLGNFANQDNTLQKQENRRNLIWASKSLPPQFQTQEGYDFLVKLLPTAKDLHKTVQIFNKLPNRLQNLINLSLLNLIAFPELLVNVFSMFETAYQTEDNFRYLANSAANSTSAQIFEYIISAWKCLPPLLRSQDNFERLNYIEKDKHLNTLLVKNLFFVLPASLKTQANLDALLNLQLANSRFDIFSRIISLRPVTQEKFDRAIASIGNINALLDEHANRLSTTLSFIPDHLFTENVLAQLYNVIQANNIVQRNTALDNFQRGLRPVIEDEAGVAEGRINYNPAQSTHNASVHKSVSESGVELIKCYGEQIDTAAKQDKIIDEFAVWVANATTIGLEDKTDEKRFTVTDHQLQAAERAVEWLSVPTISYKDPVSKVSTRELLAMIWLGAHDKERCTTDITTAYRKLIVGLYDVQRGYNQDENFKEVNIASKDRKICTAGTFNKLMEVLWGIHKLVNIKYISSEFASLKIKVLPQAVMKLYLNDVAQGNVDPKKRNAANEICILKENGKLTKDVAKRNESAFKYFSEVESALSSFAAQKFYLTDTALGKQMIEDRKNIVNVITEVQKEGISAVWDRILPVISIQMIDEYGSLYKGPKDDKFLGLVEGGKWTDVDEKFLNDLKAKTPSGIHKQGVFASSTQRESKSEMKEAKSPHPPKG